MFNKILISFFYILTFGFFLMIFLPWFFINLNNYLGLPIIAIPWLKPFGIILIFIDIANYLYCQKLFLFIGKRTPVVTENSHKLLNTGLYKYSRNPIYIGHLLMLLGIFFFFGHFLLLIYTLTMFIIFNIIVIYYEEPHLKKSLDKEYESYLQKVPRWL